MRRWHPRMDLEAQLGRRRAEVYREKGIIRRRGYFWRRGTHDSVCLRGSKPAIGSDRCGSVGCYTGNGSTAAGRKERARIGFLAVIFLAKWHSGHQLIHEKLNAMVSLGTPGEQDALRF